MTFQAILIIAVFVAIYVTAMRVAPLGAYWPGCIVAVVPVVIGRAVPAVLLADGWFHCGAGD